MREKRAVVAGKDLDRYFGRLDAMVTLKDLFDEEANDRAVAIVGAAFLDSLLEYTLTSFLVDDEKEVKRFLQTDRPLGSFGSRTTAVYCLGLIGETIRDDLRVVGKIRNRFAHNLVASFDKDPVRSWCLSLKWHAISFMRPPKGATPRDLFQVGVNQLIAHLNGIASVARRKRCEVPPGS